MSDYALITEDVLKAVGFKWHQLERQPDKHWLLWIDNQACNRGCDEIGIELAPGFDDRWFCWFRSDECCRYHRFIHVRFLKTIADLVSLVEGVSGQDWNPENHMHGRLLSPDDAALQKRVAQRLDRIIRASEPPWNESEKDPYRGKALPEHRQAYEKARDV